MSFSSRSDKSLQRAMHVHKGNVQSISYSENAPKVHKEDLPKVEGAFILHNVVASLMITQICPNLTELFFSGLDA